MTVTVKELIEMLKGEDLDRIIICQKYTEGNDYSQFARWTGISLY